MSTNVVDSNGDWTMQIANNNTQEQIKNDVITKLKEYRGDCFWSYESGIDWNYFLGTKYTPGDFEALKTQILQVCYTIANVQNVVIQDFQYNQAIRSAFIVLYINNAISITINN
jgi:hypothetical protein